LPLVHALQFAARMRSRLLALGFVVALGCGASAKNSGFDGSGGGGPNGNGGGGDNGGGGGEPGTFGGDAGSGGPFTDAACATDIHKSEASPLDIYVMLDQSGSMADTNKWGSVKAAFDTFLKSPATAGIGVGLQYFPIVSADSGTCASKCSDCTCVMNCGCSSCQCTNNVCTCLASGSSCSAADYAKADVEIAELPGAESAIEASLAAHAPNGGTPSNPALDGAIQHARAYAQAHAGHKVVVVLATDGEPNDCNSTVQNVAQLASQGAAGAPAILTFVIGVGGDLGALDAVAQAGGTTKAFLVDTGANASQEFVDALDAIRNASISCEYSIPNPSGGTIDFTKVNVEYTRPGGAPTIVGQVKDASACDPTAGGWYYDDPTHPTKIEVCAASCRAMNDGTLGVGGEVDVVYGCDTVPIVPK
jgi:hypothetical protein